MHDIKIALKEVFDSRIYIVISLVAFLSIMAFNALISNYEILWNKFSAKFAVYLLYGTLQIMGPVPLLILVINSLLAGIVIAMSVYVLKRQTATATLGSSGFIVSIIAPACPSCAIGLLSTLGIGSFLSVLPFGGIEIGFLGVGILGYSIFFLSRKINTKVCNIKPNVL